MRTSAYLRAATAVTVAGALSAPALIAVAPAQAASVPAIRVANGETQPVFSFNDAVYQVVNIETTVDTDHDGRLDTVQLRLKRPRETESGLKVPTIIEPAPYYGPSYGRTSKLTQPTYTSAPEVDAVIAERRGNGHNKEYDKTSGDSPIDVLGERAREERASDRAADAMVSGDPAVAKPAGAGNLTYENHFDNYFVPRGYAVAELDMLGTNGSTGCASIGTPEETQGVVAAVDWLNGRTRGWDVNGDPVTAANWSTGSVALKGKSYDGTLPIAAATTGVAGLKTITTVAGISNWYEWYRENGAVRGPQGLATVEPANLAGGNSTRDGNTICADEVAALRGDRSARASGDYTDFWALRNSRPDFGKIKASVFIAQGTEDYNVTPRQSTELWKYLQDNGIPRKMWLFQGAHLRPVQLRGEEWVRQQHRWYDHWLHGIENGITAEPKVDVQSNVDFATWTTQDAWPAAKGVKLKLTREGGLSTRNAGKALQTMVDKGRTHTADELAADPGAANPNRLLYVSEPLASDVRLSGEVELSVRAALDGSSPNLAALVVDYGTAVRSTYSPEGDWTYTEYADDTSRTVCFGQRITGDSGCAFPLKVFTRTTDHKVVSRGFMDANNRYSIARTDHIADGEPYSFSWTTQPADYVFRKGHRIGIVILSTDAAPAMLSNGKPYARSFSLRYPEGTRLTVQTGPSSVTLPIASGTL
ncbi:CocE/NonD family hydrolase [Bailinhaonella thermotolerans]|nr:CocE/NonD family hydrolase [Bailinhaonella thermotolerans]